MVASSDSEFDEDEEEQKEAELLQARQLDRLEEEDFLDTFITPDNKESKVGGNFMELYLFYSRETFFVTYSFFL